MDDRLKSMIGDQKTLYIRVPNETHDSMVRIAEENNTRMQYVVRLALDDYIENYDKEK